MTFRYRELCLFTLALTAIWLSEPQANAVAENERLSEGEQRLWPPDQGNGPLDSFGGALAMDGDWAVAGAPGDDVNGASDAGSAYVVQFSEGAWQVKQKLFMPGHRADGHGFGGSVAISGEWLAVNGWVSAPQHGGTSRAPLVFLFKRTEGKWSFHASLALANWHSNHVEGTPISMTSDRLLVSHRRQGKALIFERDEETWSIVQEVETGAPLVAPNGAVLTEQAAIVGRPGDGPSVGVVYEFRRNTDTGLWQQHRQISAPTPAAGDGFGRSVAHYNGRVLVGAASAAYLYQVNETGWTLEATYPAQGQVWFATAVAMSGQHIFIAASDGSVSSGVGTLITITPDVPAEWESQTFVYPRGTGSLSVVTQNGRTLLGSGYQIHGRPYGRLGAFFGDTTDLEFVEPEVTRQFNSDFGEVMALSGKSAAFGEPLWDSENHFDVGCVHLVTRDSEGLWDFEATIDSPVGENMASFGSSIALDGDYLAVSAKLTSPFLGARLNGQGRVYLYRRGEEGWSQSPATLIALKSELTQPGFFGSKVSLHGRLLAVEYRHSFTELAETYVYEIETDSTVRLIGSVSVRLHQIEDGFLYGFDHPDAASPKLRRFAIGELALIQDKVMNFPAGVVGGLRQWPSRLDFSETCLVASSVDSWFKSFQRSGSGWKAMSTDEMPTHFASRTLQDFSVAGDNLLVSSNRKAAIFSRSNSKWKLERDLITQSLNQSGNNHVHGHRTLMKDGTAIVAAGDTPLISVVPFVSFFNVSGTTLHLESEVGGERIATNDAVDLGGLVVGETTTVKLQLRNTGAVPLTLNGVVVDWEGQPSSFPNPDLPLQALAPGEVVPILLRITPPAVGDYEATITLITYPEQVESLSFRIRHEAVAARVLPVFAELPSAQFGQIGEQILLTPMLTGSRPYTCQWYRNGRALRGQTGSLLVIEKPKPSDAGDYVMKVSWRGGSLTSLAMPVALYDRQEDTLSVDGSKPLALTARCWGSDILHQWTEVDGVTRLIESWGVQGTQTAIVRAKRAEFLSPNSISSTVKVVANFRGVSRTVGTFVLFPQLASILDFRVVGPSHLLLNQMVLGLEVQTEGNAIGSLFEVSNLPPGLMINPHTGFIQGAPSRLGVWKSVFRIRNDTTYSRPLEKTFRVENSARTDFGPARSYSGHVNLGGDGMENVAEATGGVLFGRATANVTASGAVTVVLRLGGEVWRFRTLLEAPSPTASERVSELALAAAPGTIGLWVKLKQMEVSEGGDDPIELTLEARDLSAPNNVGETWPLYPHVKVTNRIQQMISGRFNVPLQVTTAPNDGAAYPKGVGFVTATARGGKSVHMTGVLPEGSAFTLVEPLTRETGSIQSGIFYQARGHTLQGSLRWSCTRADPEVEIIGNLDWHLKAREGRRVYPLGYSDAGLSVMGGKYFPPLPGRPVLPGLALSSPNVEMSLNHGAIEQRGVALPFEFPLHLSGDRRLQLPGAQFGVRLTRLIFRPATGLFDGILELPATVGDAVAKVSFRGCLVPSSVSGSGFFLGPIPRDPGDPQRAPVLLESGSIELLAK